MINGRLVMLIVAALIAVSSGCSTKVAIVKEPGSPLMPVLTGQVCISNQPLPYEIPVTRIGRINVRKRPDTSGDVMDAIAGQMRLAGANYIQIMASHNTAGWGFASFIEPKLKFNCAAAGGQLR